MKLSIQDAIIEFSDNESEFVARIAAETYLSIHDLVLLSILAFSKDGDR